MLHCFNCTHDIDRNDNDSEIVSFILNTNTDEYKLCAIEISGMKYRKGS